MELGSWKIFSFIFISETGGLIFSSLRNFIGFDESARTQSGFVSLKIKRKCRFFMFWSKYDSFAWKRGAITRCRYKPTYTLPTWKYGCHDEADDSFVQSVFVVIGWSAWLIHSILWCLLLLIRRVRVALSGFRLCRCHATLSPIVCTIT